jgi:HK97 gp10 family phage protein
MPEQGTRIEVTGLKENIRDLKKFGDTESLIAVKKANYEAAELLVRAALPLVPRRTGKLAGSLKPTRTQMYAGARAGSTSVPYAGPIHWGWFRRHIKPQPFFAKAFGYNKEQILEKYKKDMEAALAKSNLR